MPRYVIHEDGTREMVEGPAPSHPDGAAPRLEDGTVIASDGLPVSSQTSEASSQADDAGAAVQEPAGETSEGETPLTPGL